MDAIDILGSLLGRKSQSSSRGGDILRDMMAGKKRPPAPQRQPTPHRTSRPQTIEESAQSLEDLLNVSHGHHAERRQSPTTQPSPPRAQPVPRTQTRPTQTASTESMNDQAEVLVRAMIAAAKSDGQVTEQEQQEILGQLGQLSQGEIDFLNREFSRTVDVRDLAWSVPLGMEEQVYKISLIAIDLDEMKEAQYLADLAHGLRLDPRRCNDIHRQLGAPVIFQQ